MKIVKEPPTDNIIFIGLRKGPVPYAFSRNKSGLQVLDYLGGEWLAVDESYLEHFEEFVVDENS